MDTTTILLFWCLPGVLIALAMVLMDASNAKHPTNQWHSATLITAGVVYGWFMIFILVGGAWSQYTDRRDKQRFQDRLDRLS